MKIEVIDNFPSREVWIERAQLSGNLLESAKNASVLVLPAGYNANVLAFESGTNTTLAYLQQAFGDKVEICTQDEKIFEIELNSHKIRLGKFIVLQALLPLFIGVISNIISSEIMNNQRDKSMCEELPAYQEETEVEFTIMVEDTTGNCKTFKYDGTADDVKEIIPSIEKLWNNDK